MRAGLFLPSDPLIPVTLVHEYDKPTVDTLRVNGHLTLSPETQRQHQLLNFNASFIPGLCRANRPMSPQAPFEQGIRYVGERSEKFIGDMDGVATAAYWKVFKGDHSGAGIFADMRDRTMLLIPIAE